MDDAHRRRVARRRADWPTVSGFVRDAGGRGGDRGRPAGRSPRSAGSAPTRACSRARRSPARLTLAGTAARPARGGHPVSCCVSSRPATASGHGDAAGRGRHGRARPVGHDRRGRRAQAAGQGPGRWPRRRRPGARPSSATRRSWPRPRTTWWPRSGPGREARRGHRPDHRPAGGALREAEPACRRFDREPGVL